MVNDNAHSSPKRKSKTKTLHVASEPIIEKEHVGNPNNVSISHVETHDGEDLNLVRTMIVQMMITMIIMMLHLMIMNLRKR